MTQPVNEPVKTEITEPKPPIQEPTPPVEPPVVPTNEPKPAEPTDILGLIASTDKGLLLKSNVVQKLLEDARSQEKDKLYKTIEAKDNTITQLKEKISDLELVIQSKEENGMESEKELLETINSLKETQEKLIQDMEAEKEKTRKAELEAYKKDKIHEADGKLLEELVVGDSEEEIDQSIEVAKKRYAELVSPYETKVAELEEKVGKPDKSKAPKPLDPSTPSDLEFTAEDIKNMSPQEYAKYRQKILKMAKNS